MMDEGEDRGSMRVKMELLRRTFDFDDALVAIHGRMSDCGGG